jgi:hypothetical protein
MEALRLAAVGYVSFKQQVWIEVGAQVVACPCSPGQNIKNVKLF